MEAGPGRLKSFGNQHRIQRICFFESGDSGRFRRAVRSRRFTLRTGSFAASHSRYDCRRRASRRQDRAPVVIIKTLQRGAVCRRFERLDPDQLALALEDVDSDLAREEEKRPPGEMEAGERPSRRKPLPAICRAKRSASTLRVPAELRVIHTTRPKYACRTSKTLAQAPAPERPIAGGLATPALLAQVLVSKYCDHTPLYRQSQIFARHGIDLPRSTLAGWVGGACWWLEALHERLNRNVFAPDHLFADDTPVPVLDPGRGRTKTDGFGCTPASKEHGADPSRRLRSICMRRTAKLNVRPRI